MPKCLTSDELCIYQSEQNSIDYTDWHFVFERDAYCSQVVYELSEQGWIGWTDPIKFMNAAITQTMTKCRHG